MKENNIWVAIWGLRIISNRLWLGSVGRPPLWPIAFGLTVLRAPWTDFNNFWFFGKFRASSACPDVFLVFLNQTCLFQNQISKMSCVFLLYPGYIQATGWSRCRCLRLVLGGGNEVLGEFSSFLGSPLTPDDLGAPPQGVEKSQAFCTIKKIVANLLFL